MQKRALRFLYNDYSSSYEELRIEKVKKSTVNVSKYCSLCTEIFKTLNDINHSFIKDIFKLRITNRPTREKYTDSRNSKVELSTNWKKKFETPGPKFNLPYKIFRKPDHFQDSNKEL